MRVESAVLIGLVLLAPRGVAGEGPPGAAAPKRAERWRALREEKRKRPEPYRASRLEKNLLAIQKAERPSLVDLEVAGFYPRLANLASGSATAAGVRFWRPDIGPSPVDVHGSAFYSIRQYEFYDLQVGVLPHRGRGFPPRSTKGDDVYELGDMRASAPFLLYASLRYRHYPQVRFHGLGPDSRRPDETAFLHQDASYELVTGWQFNPHIVATARAGLLQAFVGPGGQEEVPPIRALFDDATAPGLDRQPDFLHLGANALIDYRDEPGNPHRGGMLGLSASRYSDREGDAFQFYRLAADARAFLSLGSPQRVLALRAYASTDEAASGRRVPFYLQDTLGGSHSLRGYSTFRFRGERLLLLQSEYRWEAWPALELVIFADAGKVARRGGSLGDSALLGDGGVGIRVKAHDRVLARVEWAKGREGGRFALRLSPAF